MSNDNTAEFLAPPYLSKGPRPRILSAPDSFQPGADLGVNYESVDPVAKALLLRMSTVTHSMQFGESKAGGGDEGGGGGGWWSRGGAFPAGSAAVGQHSVTPLLHCATPGTVPCQSSLPCPAPPPRVPADARALWLELQDNAGGWVRIKTPPSSNLVPPGNYMLVLLTDKGVPSVAKVVKARPAQPGAAAAGLLFGGGAAR